MNDAPENLSALIEQLQEQYDVAATEVKRLMEENARLEPVSMALCESHSVVLRVGVPYVFRPVGDCATCAKMFSQAVEAYGPTGGSMNTPMTAKDQ
jgi:hypothetical protein